MFKSFIKQTPFGLSILILFLAGAIMLMVAPIGGKQSLIVRSGSMTPTIGVGDLVLVSPHKSYGVGDIISFKDPVRGQTTITHRVVATKLQNGQTFFQTKGDANKAPDETLVPQKNIIGSVGYSVKDIGKLFAMVKTKNGFLTAAILPASLVIVLELINIFKEVKKNRKKAPVMPRVAVVPQEAVPVQKIIYLKKAKFRYFNYGKPMGLEVTSHGFVSLFLLFWEKLKINGVKLSDGLPYYSAAFKMILPITVSILLISGTFATFYTDSELSQNNTFKAAASFDSPKPILTSESTASALPNNGD